MSFNVMSGSSDEDQKNKDEGEIRFIFRGNAAAAAGDLFPVQSTACLPMIGGLSRSVVSNFPYETPDVPNELGRFVSFQSAATRAEGRIHTIAKENGRGEIITKQVTETTVNASVTGLRLAGVFEVQALISNMESSRVIGHNPAEPWEFFHLPKDNHIIGAKLFGRELRFRFHEKLMSYGAIDRFARGEAGGGFEANPDFKDVIGCNRYYIYYSIVDEILYRADPLPGSTFERSPTKRYIVPFAGNEYVVEITRNHIFVEGIGHFYFGEVVRDGRSSRMTLMRTKLNYDPEIARLNLRTQAYGLFNKSYQIPRSGDIDPPVDDNSGTMGFSEVGTNGGEVGP